MLSPMCCRRTAASAGLIVLVAVLQGVAATNGQASLRRVVVAVAEEPDPVEDPTAPHAQDPILEVPQDPIIPPDLGIEVPAPDIVTPTLAPAPNSAPLTDEVAPIPELSPEAQERRDREALEITEPNKKDVEAQEGLKKDEGLDEGDSEEKALAKKAVAHAKEDMEKEWRASAPKVVPKVEWRARSGDPVSRVERSLGVLKTEVGQAEIAVAEAKDLCENKHLTYESCMISKEVLREEGKLRRLHAAETKIQAMLKESLYVRNAQRAVNLEVRNATESGREARVRLSGRMVEVRRMQDEINDHHLAHKMDQEIQEGWTRALSATETNEDRARARLQRVASYEVKLRTRLEGILAGIGVGDASSIREFDAIDKLTKETRLVESRTRLLEEKARDLAAQREAEKILAKHGKRQFRDTSHGSIVHKESQRELDSFGEPVSNPSKLGSEYADLHSHPAWRTDGLASPDTESLSAAAVDEFAAQAQAAADEAVGAKAPGTGGIVAKMRTAAEATAFAIPAANRDPAKDDEDTAEVVQADDDPDSVD